MQRHRIGDWDFSPADGELTRGPQRIRLEDRAGRTLALLHARRGETVTQQEIVDAVWNGRSLSPNSVAVVIKDLRQALGDDARNPRYIETVAKRGYRLIAGDGAEPAKAPVGARILVLPVAGILVAVAVAVLAWTATRPPPGVPVEVERVENATGSAAYAPLTDALSELLVVDLGRSPGIALVRGPASAGARPRPGQIRLKSRLIMWSGKPALMLSAERTASRAVVWTGMAGGPEDMMPPRVAAVVADFSRTVRPARPAR